MSSFLLNPYNITLNLSDKDNKKLLKEGYIVLEEFDIFYGKKQYYRNFVKLIKRDLNCTRTIKALKITVEWDTSGSMDETTKILP